MDQLPQLIGAALLLVAYGLFQTNRVKGDSVPYLVLNLLGGFLAGIIVLTAVSIQGREQWNIPRSAVITATISVAMGMLIITAVSFSFQRMGVGAGIATLFLGQMLIGVLVDMFGRAGGEAIPLDLRRILGLIIMSVAVLLLIPRE